MLIAMRPPGATMKISDLVSSTDCMIDVRASGKRLLLQEFAGRAATSLGLTPDQVASYLLKREDLGSTGIGKGVALPHARLPELQQPCGLLAKLKPPIEFDAIDGQPVDIVFVLLLPAAAENEALGALALVARTLRSPENSRAAAGCKKCRRALCGNRLTDPRGEPSTPAMIIFPQPGEVSWRERNQHENIRRRQPPRSDAR